MHNDHFWNLLAKKLAGEASEEELQELSSLIKVFPDLTYAVENAACIWHLEPPDLKEDAEKAFQKHIVRIHDQPSFGVPLISAETEDTLSPLPSSSKYRKLPFLLTAAVILVTAGLLFWIKNSPADVKPGTTQSEEIYTRPGTRTKLVLPDSSVVWLNAGSKLTYSQPFGIKDRVVYLSGEAFFDVVKSGKPFIIHTNGVHVKVLGTTFNVRSYPDESMIETSLVRGQVEVTIDQSQKKYILNPNEKLTLNTNDLLAPGKTKKEAVSIPLISTLHYLDENTIAETSWIENKLVFADESFEQIAKKMERWYGVTISFKDEELKTERFTGVFEKETAWQALNAMQLVTPFHFSFKNDEIIITN